MSSNLSNDFNAFSRFVAQELAAGEEISLEECLERWRATQPNGSKASGDIHTPFQKASRLGLVGCIDDAPDDLASNPRYMEGFGES